MNTSKAMKDYGDHVILDQPIQTLQVSDEFTTMCQTNGFYTIRDLLRQPLYLLPTLPRSSYRILKELLDLLISYGLEDLLED